MEGGGQSKVRSPEDSAARRARECYVCSFCNRGFTNAQALGGHMNVHRKERLQQQADAAAAGGAQLGGGIAGGSQKTGSGSGDVDLELRLWH